MAVKIGSARIDERGKISGGKAGDQTGNEVGTQNFHKEGFACFGLGYCNCTAGKFVFL